MYLFLHIFYVLVETKTDFKIILQILKGVCFKIWI
nr:MAG TPA: hypothetical protein [Caudoviricetes sp.]